MGSPPPSPPIVSISCPGYDLVGATRTFTASVDQFATIYFYFNESLVGTYSGISASFTSGPGTAGCHLIRTVASNSNGSTEAICLWKVGNGGGTDSVWFFNTEGLQVHLGLQDTNILWTLDGICVNAVANLLIDAGILTSFSGPIFTAVLHEEIYLQYLDYTNNDGTMDVCIPQSSIPLLAMAIANPMPIPPIPVPITVKGIPVVLWQV